MVSPPIRKRTGGDTFRFIALHADKTTCPLFTKNPRTQSALREQCFLLAEQLYLLAY